MTLDPGQEHHLWANGYKSTDKPQLDAYPVATFAEGTFSGIGAKIWYGDFSCKLDSAESLGNSLYTYYITVKNIGTVPTMYNFRLWVP